MRGLKFQPSFGKGRTSQGHSQLPHCKYGNISKMVPDGVIVTTDH